MEHLRQIEEDLRSIGVESKKKYPEVVEAAEQALDTLKAVREAYVNELRRAGSKDIVKIAQASDLSSPYILLCNYADCQLKLINMALNSLQQLLNYEVVPSVDAPNILRVLLIQVSAARSESQPKIIQIVLQLASLLTKDKASLCMATDQSVQTMLSVLLCLCEGKHSLSISSAASGTLRQVIALFLDRTAAVLEATTSVDEDSTSVCVGSAVAIVREVSSYLVVPTTGGPKQTGSISQLLTLEIVHEILEGWHRLFAMNNHLFQVFQGALLPNIKNLLKNLRSDFVAHFTKLGSQSATTICSKTVGLARIVLMNFDSKRLRSDQEAILALLVDNLSPLREFNTKDIEPRATPSGAGKATKGSASVDADSIRSKIEEASAMILPGGASALLSKFSLSAVMAPNTSTPPAKALASYDKRAFLLTNNRSHGEPTALEPSWEQKGLISITAASCCLNTLVCTVFKTMWQSVDNWPLDFAFYGHLLLQLCRGCYALILNILNSDTDSRELENLYRHSPLHHQLQPFVDDGEIHVIAEASTRDEHTNDTLWSTLHAHFHSGSGTAGELLLYAIDALQLIIKLSLRVSLLSKDTGNGTKGSAVLISPAIIAAETSAKRVDTRWLCDVVEQSYEGTLDACSSILTICEGIQIQRCAVTILTELALVTCVLGLTKPCQITLSLVCKNALPLWHGVESSESVGDSKKAADQLVATASAGVKWRHVHLFTRLLQIVHVIADAISDWDCVTDCLEQAVAMLAADTSDGAGGGASQIRFHQIHDRNKFIAAIDRFSDYSIFLSNDSLIRMMTSFVALSMNNVSIFSTGLVGDHRSSSSERNGSKVMEKESAAQMYSLRAVLEITKKNSFRIASIWQMVVSHLRMIAASKMRSKREMAVEATFDIITSFIFQQKETNLVDYLISTEVLTDEVLGGPVDDPLLLNVRLSDFALPSLDSIFLPRTFHRNHLERVLQACSTDPQLCQADLLSCLLPMSAVRYDDVLFSILRNLAVFLHSNAPKLEVGENGGWRVVLEVLGSVPLTHTTSVFRSEWTNVYQRYWSPTLVAPSSDPRDGSGGTPDDTAEDFPLWPREALADAFSSTMLIVDEFFEGVAADISLVQSLLEVLSLFGSQTADTNISLTAVEVLWKVADSAIRMAAVPNPGIVRNESEFRRSIIEVMQSRLYQLSLDSRPEIRQCAINTLFIALANNDFHHNVDQWKSSFENIISPLFEKIGARSQLAMRINEQAVAPELKKGVKMVVHHSRDTAHKQWSETRTLALRGLLRVLKSVVSLDMDLSAIWLQAAEISKVTVLASIEETEVANAGMDVLFGMLKLAADAIGARVRENRDRQSFMAITHSIWKQLSSIADRCFLFTEWAADLIGKVSEFYCGIKKSSEVVEASVNNLLDVVFGLCFQDRNGNYSGGSREHLAATDLLRTSVIRLLSDLLESTPSARLAVVRRMSELCFTRGRSIAMNGVDYCLIVPLRLRDDVAAIVARLLDADYLVIGKVILESYFRMVCLLPLHQKLSATMEAGITDSLEASWSIAGLESSLQRLQQQLNHFSPQSLLVHQINSDLTASFDDCAANRLAVGVFEYFADQHSTHLHSDLLTNTTELLVATITTIFGGRGYFTSNPWMLSPLTQIVRTLLYSSSLAAAFRVKLLSLLWMALVDGLIACGKDRSAVDEQSGNSVTNITVAAVLELLIDAVRSENCDEDMRQSALAGIAVVTSHALAIEWGTSSSRLSDSISMAFKCIQAMNLSWTRLDNLWATLCFALTAVPKSTAENSLLTLVWLSSISADNTLELLCKTDQHMLYGLEDRVVHVALFDCAVAAIAHCGDPLLRSAALDFVLAINVRGMLVSLSKEMRDSTEKLGAAIKEVTMLKAVTSLPF